MTTEFRKMSNITNAELDQALAVLHAAGIYAHYLAIWERAKALTPETKEYNEDPETDPEDVLTVAEYYDQCAEFECWDGARDIAQGFWCDIKEAAIRQGVPFPVYPEEG